MDLGLVDLELAEQIGRMEPFGEGNREPSFRVRDVPVQSARMVGERHLRLRLGDAGRSVSAIGFGMADRAPAAAGRIDVAFQLRIDDYQGVRRPDLVLLDFMESA